ncbi:MAG: formylglycine-generating enzyme family protein [Gemmataceae bacterium]
MSDFQRLLDAIPGDPNVAFILADYLEERGDPRCELLRLSYTLKDLEGIGPVVGRQIVDDRQGGANRPKIEYEITPERLAMEERLRELLLVEKLEPVVPKVTNELGMEFAWVPPGTFLMGSPESEEERDDNETQHRVTLTKGLYVGTTAVTQRHWQSVMGNNPSHFTGEDTLPVECVSWDDCQAFVQALNTSEKSHRNVPGRKGGKFALLTEAQWEYACRAGTTTEYYSGNGVEALREVGWYGYDYGNSNKTTHSVHQLKPNAWGLYDMHGNVWEWCQDRFDDYPNKDIKDPQGVQSGSGRVLRGGSWDITPALCRSACRCWDAPDLRSSDIGCRVAFRLD